MCLCGGKLEFIVNGNGVSTAAVFKTGSNGLIFKEKYVLIINIYYITI